MIIDSEKKDDKIGKEEEPVNKVDQSIQEKEDIKK